MRLYDQYSHQDEDSDGPLGELMQGSKWRTRGLGATRGAWPCAKPTVRLFRLAIVCLLCPALLLGWPLYMRYHVLREFVLPLAPSDVRVMDLRVSTTWCQAQVVQANGSFNAWVVGERPRRGARRLVSLVRDIRLGDDMKEYWGFYLLEGSSVTVSPCVRWPGVSLVVIRGYDHLQQCAYIGDDSSEEAEEVRRAALRQQLERGLHMRPKQPTSPPDADPDAFPPSEPQASPPTSPATRVRSVPTPSPPTLANTTKQRSNLPKRMQRVKEAAVEFHVKTRPPPRLFFKLDGLEDDEESPESAAKGSNSSAEVARGMLDRLLDLGATGRRALDRLRTARLSRDLGRQESEDGNTAAEQAEQTLVKEPQNHGADFAADIRGSVNETTSLDESHSELWSSFSSSEEALLGCAGLVLNLPLTPHRDCQRRRPVEDLHVAAAANVITYRVPADGHYFFVLGSENEVQTNFVRVRFDLDKYVYEVDHPLAQCSNQTASSACSLPLRFLSDDTLVLEVPVDGLVLPSVGIPGSTPHDSHQDHVIAVSTCEPRSALFIACVLALPAIILACAFN